MPAPPSRQQQLRSGAQQGRVLDTAGRGGAGRGGAGTPAAQGAAPGTPLAPVHTRRTVPGTAMRTCSSGYAASTSSQVQRGAAWAGLGSQATAPAPARLAFPLLTCPPPLPACLPVCCIWRPAQPPPLLACPPASARLPNWPPLARPTSPPPPPPRTMPPHSPHPRAVPRGGDCGGVRVQARPVCAPAPRRAALSRRPTRVRWHAGA